jgi:tetratricopeptide (TPR) repeat protein
MGKPVSRALVLSVGIALQVLLTANAEQTLQPRPAKVTARPQADRATVLAGIRPSVVTVKATGQGAAADTLGSGVVVGSEGIVLTAWHVIAKAAAASVVLPGGESIPVSGLLGWDSAADFALLKVAGRTLTAARLGDSDRMRQGDSVLAIGSPLGMEQTASEGIVSAVRDLPDGGKLLQVTAAVSPGSSGGPVLNAAGEVVGITSFRVEGGESLGFAMPINAVKPKLAEAGRVTPLREVVAPDSETDADELYARAIKIMPVGPGEKDEQTRSEQALALLKSAAEKRPDFASAYHFMGECLWRLGRRQEALDSLHKAVALNPKLIGSYMDLGDMYVSLGDFAKAAEAYERARALNPRLPRALHGVGVAYRQIGKLDKAIAAFREEVRLQPDATAYLALGLVLAQAGQLKEAEDVIRAGIRLQPQSGEGYNLLGMVYAKTDRQADAVEALKQAVAAEPDRAEWHRELGRAYMVSGFDQEVQQRDKRRADQLYGQAVEALKQAVRCRPEDPETHHLLAGVYYQLHKGRESVESAKEAIRLRPDFANAHFQLGISYLALGNKGGALDEYKVLKDLDPSQAADLFREIYP